MLKYFYIKRVLFKWSLSLSVLHETDVCKCCVWFAWGSHLLQGDSLSDRRHQVAPLVCSRGRHSVVGDLAKLNLPTLQWGQHFIHRSCSNTEQLQWWRKKQEIVLLLDLWGLFVELKKHPQLNLEHRVQTQTHSHVHIDLEHTRRCRHVCTRSDQPFSKYFVPAEI